MDTGSRMRRRPGPLRLAASIFLAACAFSHGRIFESLGRIGRDSYETLPGWSRAYAAPFVLNGGRADVEVWSAPESLSAALARLRDEAKRQGGIAAFFPGTAMAWGLSTGGGRVSRILLAEMEGGRQTLVFRFSQTEAVFRQTAAGLRNAALPDNLPVYPGARAEFIAVNEQSGVTFAVFTVPGAAVADARAYLARALEQAGWIPALGAAAAAYPGMGFYTRRNALCGWTAKLSGNGGDCVVTLLHRRLKTGESF